jgi:RNAse (barnase) inhibitor barstar
VLPESLGFKNLSIRLSDVVLETEAGSFLLDAASGGVLSLIDLAWQIYAFSKTSQMANSERFVVVMDEPENHLHPSMQRMLLGSLLDAFPSAQFIIATHSPFMVSSVKDSAVYALRYMSSQQNSSNEDIEDGLDLSRQVFSERLDVVNRAGNAAEILRDVLGVPVTVPLWVETQLNSLVIEYRNRELTVESLSELRERMTDLGFGEMYPTALAGVVGV